MAAGFRFAPREGALDLGAAGRGCLTAEHLRAWAAALPWMGPSPPPLEVLDEIPPLYAAAEALAASLDPQRAPTLADVLRFLCALTALERLPASGRHAQVSVQRGAQGLLVRVPVRSGVRAPDFRAGFLVLRLALGSSEPAILLWRELVPALADPALIGFEELDPRFCGTQPCSSWVRIDPVSLHMSVGDISLFSREPNDWLPGEPREGYDELPLPAVDPCLSRERLWSWAEGWLSGRPAEDSSSRPQPASPR